MRLRGPWIVRGSRLDTSISGTSGFIAAFGDVQIPMSPYTFYPACLHSRSGTTLWVGVPFGSLAGVDADSPSVLFKNSMGSTVSYAVKWRHVNP